MDISLNCAKNREKSPRGCPRCVIHLDLLTIMFLRLLTLSIRELCARRPTSTARVSSTHSVRIEGLSQRMRISGYGGLILALPVVMWQIWRFVVPALSSREKKYSVPFILSSVVLFAFGGALAYWTLDKALEFLISWSGEGVEQTYQISRYVSLVALMVLAFGVGFLLPVLIVFLQLVNVITPQALLKQWRVSFMVIFVLAAVITPSGDPISMMALALPMSLLFLIAVAIGFIAQRRRRNREVSISD